MAEDYKKELEKYFEKKDKEEIEEIEDLEDIKGTTREYKIFKKGGAQISKKFYEKVCQLAGRILKVKLPEKEENQLRDKIKLLNLKIDPSDTASLSLLSLLFFIALTAGSLLIHPILSIVFAVGAVGSYYYLRNFPRTLLERRKRRSSSELVLATLYIVTYMRHVQNLEKAIKFASDNLTGPLAEDFRKVLWDVESKRFDNILMALDNYLRLWEDTNREFVEAMYLVESTLFQKREKFRQELLDRAVDRIINGTYRRMVNYAGELKNPIQAIYMLGIVLPILGMVLFPMLISVLSGMMQPKLLAVGYNVVLPIFVFILIRNTLKKRPSGFPQPDVSQYPKVPKKHSFLFRGKNIPAWLPAILAALLIASPFIYYNLNHEMVTPKPIQIYISLPVTIAIGTGVFLYTKLASFQKMKVLERVYAVESEFSHGIFQLGTMLSQGDPPEQAIRKVAESMKGSETANFFHKIDRNMERLGLSFSRAIFDPKEGAVRYFPSPIVRSSMQVLVKTAQKSLEHAGNSMINLATYLRRMGEINDRVKDVLQETVSSMQFQVNLLAPVVSGVVVGLTSMITIIMTILSQKMAQVSQMFGEGSTTGMPTTAPQMSFLTGIFQMTKAVPLHYFQLMVGIYTIEVVVLIGYAIANIQRIGSTVYRNDKIAGMSILPTIIYTGTAAVMTVTLTSLAKLTVGATQVFGG